jgi:catechol 2,3-dioxygenase-like lactoylglutathione lyase family enzyme
MTVKVLINIDVPELRPAVDFYCAALGLGLNRIIDGDVAELTGGSCLLYLLQKPSGLPVSPSVSTGRDYNRHWTPVHFDFVVDDLENARQRALQAGAREESGCVTWMGSKCISFSDPFGHGFCLIQFTADGYADPEDSTTGASHRSAANGQADMSDDLVERIERPFVPFAFTAPAIGVGIAIALLLAAIVYGVWF